MTQLTDFSPDLVRLLPATHALLLASNLSVSDINCSTVTGGMSTW